MSTQEPVDPIRRVSVRRATIDDLPTLLELVAEYCAADGHAFDAHATQRALGPLLTDDRHGVVWTIHVDDNDQLEGYACVTWGYSIEAGGPEALFDELYVRQQGVGIGSRAMHIVVDEVRRRGPSRIYLETERHNERGRRLYERLGFATEDSVWMSLDWRTASESSGHQS